MTYARKRALISLASELHAKPVRVARLMSQYTLYHILRFKKKLERARKLSERGIVSGQQLALF